MNIILMGYRCTGKTTAGRCLAERMGLPFYDTDELVERKAQRAIPQIVAEQGWQAFREAESGVIRDLSGVDRSVIALGGGAILDARNLEVLKQGGVFVWLFAAPETIAKRMEKDAATGAERPSLTDKSSIGETHVIMTKREPLYRRIADLAIDTTRFEPDQVVAAIQSGLRDRISRTGEIIKGKEK